jgi:cytochrome c553
MRFIIVCGSVLIGLSLVLPALAADSSEMADRVKACAGCHGEGGRSVREGHFPSIAGKPAGYLWQQLLNFRDNRRPHQLMQQMLAYLSDDYLLAIANHYAAQTPKVATPVAAQAPEMLARGRTLSEQGDLARGIPACTGCHGADLLGSQPAIPGLIGLPRDYLLAQLGAWRSGVRRAAEPDCMAQIVMQMSESDISDVTAWVASLPTDGGQRPAAEPPPDMPMDCGGVP